MPHSPNMRWIKKDGHERAVHLNSKGAKKFDAVMAKHKALQKAKGGKKM